MRITLPNAFFLTSSSSGWRRADRTSRTPCSANAKARSFPIPLDAPVTQTTLPLKAAEIEKKIFKVTSAAVKPIPENTHR